MALVLIFGGFAAFAGALVLDYRGWRTRQVQLSMWQLRLVLRNPGAKAERIFRTSVLFWDSVLLAVALIALLGLVI